jgi:FkbM family methyltransferase
MPDARRAKRFCDAIDYWFHAYKPKPGHTIVDIGAGRGEDVFVFSECVGPAGRVFAIEAHAESYARLSRVCREERLGNVTCVHAACVEEPGWLWVESLPVWESNFVHPGPPTPLSQPVEGLPFDSLCERLGLDQIDYLKMNIEGAELHALPGAAASLRRARFVTICAHDFRAARGEGEHFRTLEFVKKTLSEAGFDLVLRDSDPRYYVPYHVHGIRRA